MKLLLASALLAALAKSTDAAGAGNFFTYFEQGGFGPSNWAFLDIEGNQCGGTQGKSGYGQSPVSISEEVSDTCDTDMAAYSFTGGDCTWDQLDFSISNNGVKATPKTTECSFGSMSIPHTPNRFNALQFHVHTYSEHQIAGQGDDGFFPAELHVVHQEGNLESFAVFGTMIDVGTQEHTMFEFFLRGWEAAAGAVEAACPARRLRSLAETQFEPVQEVVKCPAVGTNAFNNTPSFPVGQAPNVYELPTNPEFGVFTYKGGLTTPGCTEIVNWNLLDTPMLISQTQMDRLQALILCFVQRNFAEDGTTVKSCHHGTVADAEGSTSRPPQPLNGRKVTHRCPNGPANVIVDQGELPPGEGFVKPAPREEPANIKPSNCNKAFYEGCSKDARFNTNISPNIKASEPSWNNAEGYWVGTLQAYNARGQPLLENFASGAVRSTIPYPSDEVKVFVNITIQETRYYEHIYYVYEPATSVFCSLPIPAQAFNVLGRGTCGETGLVAHGEKFGTATFEKDGSVNVFYANGRFAGSTEGEAIPVDGRTFYTAVGNEEFSIAETFTFSNGNLTQISGSGQYFFFSDIGAFAENPLAASYTFVTEQVDMETFKMELEDAQADANVLPSERLGVISSGDCVDVENCPSEELFATYDPKTAESPYQDESTVKPGFIAMFVILALIVVVGALYYMHLRRLSAQADRYKQQFAKRVASTIRFSGNLDNFDASTLQEQFQQLDTDGNGDLSKAEMRQFMGDKIDERDFDAMFAAMDIDGNGTVEFAEFCAFLATLNQSLAGDTDGSDSD